LVILNRSRKRAPHLRVSDRIVVGSSVKNHITVLTVGADTSAFEAGKYDLAIRQVGWGWYRYPVKMK